MEVSGTNRMGQCLAPLPGLPTPPWPLGAGQFPRAGSPCDPPSFRFPFSVTGVMIRLSTRHLPLSNGETEVLRGVDTNVPRLQRSSWVQHPAYALARSGHSPSSMTTLMSRTEPARALAKNSFSSSVAIRTRNMVGGEQAGWTGKRSGPAWPLGSSG